MDTAFKLSGISSKRILSIPVLEKYEIMSKMSTRDFESPGDFLSFLDIDPRSAVMAEQVHGDKIISVNHDDKGKGMALPPVQSVDALITNEPNIPLVIRTADCVPLFMFEPRKRVIGLAHAGWKGSILRIAEKTLGKMSDDFKISIPDCIIAIGPSICRDCYTVDEQVIKPLKHAFKDHSKYIEQIDHDHWHFDLQRMNIEQLKGLGVKESNIHISGYCTHCDNDLFYSFRKEGELAKRIFSVIMLKN